MLNAIRTIAVLGTGVMGAPMAANMARAGLSVRTWDPVPERAAAVEGAEPAASAAEAADGADAVLTMVPDGEAAGEALFGESGAAARLRAGAVWIQSATIGVGPTEGLAARAAEHGLVFVDAPMLGTTPSARSGQLRVLASGPEEAHAACEPVFSAVGEKTTWLGEAGRGSRMKLVFNGWLLTQVAGVAESLALAEALGFEPQELFQVVEGTPADTTILRSAGGDMLRGAFEPGLSLEHARKDALLIIEAARDAGVEPLLTEVMLGRIERALRLGHGGRAYTSIYLGVRG
jgi:3-hydroxyisobutyrate dehydrogenase